MVGVIGPVLMVVGVLLGAFASFFGALLLATG